MTRRQRAALHAALKVTETEYSPKSGLPICDDGQLAQRRGIIAEHDRLRRVAKTAGVQNGVIRRVREEW